MKRKRILKAGALTTDPTSMNYCICHDMIENGLDMSETTYKSKWYKGFRLVHTCGFYSLEFKEVPNTVEIIYCPWCGRKLSHSDFVEERKYKAFKELKWD